MINGDFQVKCALNYYYFVERLCLLKIIYLIFAFRNKSLRNLFQWQFFENFLLKINKEPTPSDCWAATVNISNVIHVLKASDSQNIGQFTGERSPLMSHD